MDSGFAGLEVGPMPPLTCSMAILQLNRGDQEHVWVLVLVLAYFCCGVFGFCPRPLLDNIHLAN